MKFLKVTIYAIILIAAFTTVGFARAQINPMLDFTGKITETDGSELADGVYDMNFRLYDSATGGVSLWSEDLTAANCFSGSITAVGSSADGIVYTYSGGSASSTLRVGQYLSSDSANAGALITDFNHDVSTITVASSSEIWSMGDVINNRPFIEGGVIDVSLGSVSSLASVDFNQPLYLEVVFNSETMQPRKLYSSAASAFNADKLDGYDASAFANLSTDAAISGEWSFEEILSIASSSNVSVLTVTQNGSGNIVEFKRGTSTYLSVLNDGKIQIGNYTLPADRTGASAGYVLKLAANGNMYWDVDFAGSGGGSGLWASSSNNLFIYQSDSGQAVVLGNNATTSPFDIQLEVEGASWFDVVGISDSQELRFYDSDSSNYMAIRASSSYASNFILTLPADAGTDGKALITDGNGNLRWGAPTSFTYVNPGTIGQIPYYAEIGSALSATSSIFISTAGYFGIGTTTPAALLSVGANIGSQLLINENGTVTAGAWQGNIIGVAYGGTGTSTFEANSLLYAPVDNTIGEILAGTDGYVLKMTGGTPVWRPDLTVGGESSLWATTSDSLAIRPTDINQVIIIGGAATTTDNIDLEVIGNAAFGGSISAQALSLINALAVAYGGTGSTTPSGILLGDGAGNIVSLQNSSDNWNTAYSWHNHAEQGYFSTTSNHILEVAFGGTGTSTFEANSLVYASADNILSQIMPGANGYALVMQGGAPIWASTSPGTSHDLLSAMHPDTEPAVTARGDLIFGSSTAKWTRLGLGPTGYILRSDGTDAAWSTTTDITALGVIEAGTWQADVISPLFGGTGKSSWQSGSIVFATSSDIIDELLIGAEGRILQAVNGKPVWVATSSLGIDFNGVGGTLGAESGGTGADSSGWNGMVQVVSGSWSAINGIANQVAYWTDASTIASEAQLSPSRGGTGADMNSATGFLYFDNGVSVASNTIAAIRTDLTDDNSGVELTGNVLSLNTGGNWDGTFDGYEANQLFILADWLATTSAPQLVNLENLATVGTITVGAWNGDPITDAYIASSSHWNLAYFGRVTGANNNLIFTDNQIGVAGGYEIPSTASTSKWNSAYNTVTAGSADWDAVFASSSIYDLVYASSTYYDIAYNWGSHATKGYLSTTSGHILETAFGGTGKATLTDLIILGDYTTGNYISSTTGSDMITITGTPGEGWVPAFSITDDSITEDKLSVSNAGSNGHVLTYNGSTGNFAWSATGGSSGQVSTGLAGQLAFYQADGIIATGTTNLHWDNINYRLGIGTTTPGTALSVGTTINNQFLVSSAGIVSDGTWQGDIIDDQYVASSTYWNAACASSTYWDLAYNWDDHSTKGYLSTTSGHILETAFGGTGKATLTDLIILGDYTTGNYISSTTGSDMITITGTPGEGWVPAFSITDDSITEAKLDISNGETSGYVLTSDGAGGFAWSEAGASSGQIKHGLAGQLAFYQTDGIIATGTTNLHWDNVNSRLGIGTTTPTSPLFVYSGDGVNLTDYLVKIINDDITDNQGMGVYIQGGDSISDEVFVIEDYSGNLIFEILGNAAMSIGQSENDEIESLQIYKTVDGSYLKLERDSVVAFTVGTGSGVNNDDLVFNNNNFGDYIFLNGNLSIGTTTPSSMLTVGATTSEQFLVNSIGQVIGGEWKGTAISNAYIASSSYWDIAHAERGSQIDGDYLTWNSGSGKLDVTDHWYDSLADMTLATGSIYVGDTLGHPAASSDIYIAANHYVGIGTTSPLTKADIYGNLILSGNDRYINFADTIGSSGYGIRDNGGMLEYKSSSGAWTTFESLGVSTLAGLTDVSVGGVATGSLLYYASSGDWEYIATSSIGLVTSVGLSVPTGLTISNSPITTSGTLAIGLDGSYIIPRIASTTNWEATYASSTAWDAAHAERGSQIDGNYLTWSAGNLDVTDHWYDSLADMTLATGSIYVGDTLGHPAASSDIYIAANHYVGIGTTSPLTKADIYGNLILSGNDRYINFADTIGSSGYGIRDNGGMLEYKSSSGAWTTFESLGVSTLAGLTDVSVGGVATGSLLYYASSGDWEYIATSSIGLVTSVGLSVPTGLTISNSPITTSGTLAIGLDGSYIIPRIASTTNWEATYASSTAWDAAHAERGSQIDGNYLTWSAGNLDVTDHWYDSLADMTLATGSIYVGDTLGHPAASSDIYIAANHYVGIGTTTPTNQLDVYGNIGVLNNNELRLYEQVSDGTNYIALKASSTLGSTLTWTLPINNGISGNALTWDTNGELIWSTPSGTGGTVGGADFAGQLPYYASGSDTLTATSSIYLATNGYFGIGTATPETRLSVYGDLSALNQGTFRLYELDNNGMNYVSFRATSTLGDNTIYTWPDDGSSGQAMMTDSHGNLYWGDPAGSGVIDSGTIGYVSYYVDNNNHIGGTSTIFISSNERVGISSTTQGHKLSVGGYVNSTGLCINGDCKTDWATAGAFDGGGAANEIAYWIDSNTLSSTSTLAINLGGTGAQNAADARDNLGLTIGTNIQAYDVGLFSIAGLNTSADKMIYTTGLDAYSTTTLTLAGRNLLDDLDATAQRATLGLTDIYTYGITAAGDYGDLWMSNGTGAGDWKATNTIGLLAPSNINTLSKLNAIVADAAIASTSSAMTGTFDGIDFANNELDTGKIWYGGADAVPSELTIGSGGQVLMSSNGNPAWISTSTFIVDNDFSSNGIMVRTSDGVYGIITDSSSDWDATYASSTVWDAVYASSTVWDTHVSSTGADHTYIDQNVTTTGTPSFAQVTIDNIVINGSNIGHTSDTDLMALAVGAITINGNIALTGTIDGVDLANASSTWDAKQDALSTGNLTEASSDVLTVSGGTGAVIGGGASIQVNLASPTNGDTTHLSSADQIYDFVTGRGYLVDGSSITLGSLADVATTSLATNDILYWNGSNWVPAATSTWDTNTTYTAGTGLTLNSEEFNVNTSQNIATLSNLTNNGFVITSGGTGALSIDTSTYLTSSDINTLSELNTIVADAAIASTSSDMTGTFDGIDFTNGTLAEGALWYGGASVSPSELTIGTSGYILMSDGANPTWVSTSTFVMDNDFSSNGIMVRTSDGGYNTRFATGTINEISVINPTGEEAGDIQFGLPDLVYLGTSGKIGSDANNLIDFSVDSQLVFRTNGSDQMYLDSSGNFMIGTSTAGAKLTVMSGSDSQLRLAYDTDTYVDLEVSDTGEFTINGSDASASIIQIGNDLEKDAGLVFDGKVADFWLAVDDTDDLFKIGTSTTIGSSTVLSILQTGAIGIGTTTATGLLTVGTTGDGFIIDSTGIVTAGTWNGDIIDIAYGGTGTSTAPTYGYMLIGNSAGDGWDYVASSTLGGGGSGGVGTGLTGQFPYYAADGTTLTATSSIFIDTTGYVGIGTTSPSAKLTVWADGTSGLSAFSVIDSASSTLFTVLDNGYVGIGTTSPSQELSVDGLMYIGGTGTSTITDNLHIMGNLKIGSDSLDNVIINGANIGHTSDADLMALASGAVTINGNIVLTGMIDGVDLSSASSTWDAKQDALSTGNLTETTSSVLTVSGGAGAVIGSGATIQVSLASPTNGDTSHLSTADQIYDFVTGIGYLVDGSSITLGSLSDVSTTSLAINDILYWDGSDWVPTATSTWDTNTTYTAGAGLTLSSEEFSVNTSQNIATLSNLTNNGFVITSGGTGALSIDTSTYLTSSDINTLSELNTIVADATIASTSSDMTGTFDGIDFTDGTLAEGALWYGGSGVSPSELTIGTSGYILMSDGANPTWVSTSTFVMDNDFSSNGIMVRTSDGGYNTRFATGTINEISVINPTGEEAGDIQFGLPDLVYLGTSGKIGSDANNLIDFSVDSQLVFRTNGSDQMYLDSSGNFMIGTSTAGAKLTVMSGSDSQLRLAYDTDTYVDLEVSDTGKFTINGSDASASIIQIGNDLEKDAGLVFDSKVADFWLAVDDTDDLFKIGTSTTIGSSTVLSILQTGAIGIGTTTATGLLTVGTTGDGFIVDSTGTVTAGTWNGDIIDIAYGGTGTSTSPTYGYMLIGNSAGDGWDYVASSTLGGGGSGGVGTGLTGQFPYYAADGTTLTATSSIFIDTTGYVGIGTTSPSQELTVYGDMFLEGTDRHIYFGTTTDATGYGIRDVSGTMKYKDMGGSWTAFSAGGGASVLNDLTNVDAATVFGNLLYYNGSSWDDIATSALAVALSDTTGTLEVDRGGTGLTSITDGWFLIGDSATSLEATSSIFMDASGRIGIGTTTPNSLLTVNGDISIENQNGLRLYEANANGINYAGLTATSSMASSITWTLPAADGTAGQTLTTNASGNLYWSTAAGGSMAIGSSITSATAGSVLFADGSGNLGQDNDNFFWDYTNNRLGLGTTTPMSKLSVKTTGTQLTLAYDDSNYTNITTDSSGKLGVTTSANTQSAITIGTGAAKDAGIIMDGNAQDFYFALDDTDDMLKIGTSTAIGTNVILSIDSATGNVGIGTTSPYAKLAVVDISATVSDDIFVISTSTSGAIFRVDGAGEVYADGGTITPGADYAEYFWTSDTDLVSGEVVCVDITRDNAVKRCERGADGNVMGIVSSNPAIIGNAKAGYEDNINYKIIGMLGQVAAKVSAENGPIRPGDSLTSASSTPGYVMKAGAGDSTVGVALEGLEEERGVINVLISRRNKSLTVEEVEEKVIERIAAMEIEDEVNILIAGAINSLDLDDEINELLDPKLLLLSTQLSVTADDFTGQISSINDELLVISYKLLDLDNEFGQMRLDFAEQRTNLTSLTDNIVIDDDGNIKMGKPTPNTPPTPSQEGTSVAVVEIYSGTTTDKIALVINQEGLGDVADFQSGGVSIVNIAQGGEVAVVGEMSIDGRLMVCSGAGCGEALDSAVDETLGDMGVEGTVVAGAFAGYCEDGYIWVPGSSKYGTMPGFCVNEKEMKYEFTDELMVNMTQGEAMLTCEAIGDGYHLISENEWLTIAENIIRVIDNDIDEVVDGLQLASAKIATSAVDTQNLVSSSSIEFILSNKNIIYDFVGGVSEWTGQTITTASVFEPQAEIWQEYFEIDNYQGFNVAPPYYYTSENNIGKILTGTASTSSDYLRAFVRGENALFDLDLSHSPIEATSTIGFRCAR